TAGSQYLGELGQKLNPSASAPSSAASCASSGRVIPQIFTRTFEPRFPRAAVLMAPPAAGGPAPLDRSRAPGPRRPKSSPHPPPVTVAPLRRLESRSRPPHAASTEPRAVASLKWIDPLQTYSDRDC